MHLIRVCGQVVQLIYVKPVENVLVVIAPQDALGVKETLPVKLGKGLRVPLRLLGAKQRQQRAAMARELVAGGQSHQGRGQVNQTDDLLDSPSGRDTRTTENQRDAISVLKGGHPL